MLQEEWDNLSPEEQEKRIEEKPASSSSEVKEDVVIIDGKPRPLRNFLAERDRKLKEDILNEVRSSRPAPVAQPPQNSSDWERQVNEMAEKEIEETGRIVPVRTLGIVANYIAQSNINSVAMASKSANKIIKEVKKELKSRYKDYSDYEDKFNEMLEDTDPKYISKEGLVVVFNSIRGERLDEIIKARDEKTREEALKDKKIIGDINVSGGTKHLASTKKLTPEQEKEILSLGFETEEDYLGRLEKYRKLAKDKGAKNIPELIGEPLRYDK